MFILDTQFELIPSVFCVAETRYATTKFIRAILPHVPLTLQIVSDYCMMIISLLIHVGPIDGLFIVLAIWIAVR